MTELTAPERYTPDSTQQEIIVEKARRYTVLADVHVEATSANFPFPPVLYEEMTQIDNYLSTNTNWWLRHLPHDNKP